MYLCIMYCDKLTIKPLQYGLSFIAVFGAKKNSHIDKLIINEPQIICNIISQRANCGCRKPNGFGYWDSK